MWKARTSQSNIGGPKATTTCWHQWRQTFFAARGLSLSPPFSPPPLSPPKLPPWTIPSPFATAPHPVRSGLATSFNRPGSNAPGVSDFGVGLAAKRLGLLHELLPGAASFAALVNPDNPFISDPFVAEVQVA